MTAKQTNKYREGLLAMSDKIQHDAAAIEEQACQPTGGQSDGGLSNAPMHLADMGTDLNLQEVNTVLLENERYLFGEVQAALKRMESGEFGRCEGCGKGIGSERLEAIPYARNCVQCAAQQEQTSSANVNSGRPRQATMRDRDDRQLEAQRLDNSAAQREGNSAESTRFETNPDRDSGLEVDIHAAGTAGGGTAVGGLAGTNIGRGDPRGSELERAMGSGEFDIDDGVTQEAFTPLAGHAGGAIAGTPSRETLARRVKV